MSTMKRLGRVSHISQRGSVVVRTDKTPPMGARVVDKQVQPVGVVVDVFGPVKRPYVAVRPVKQEGTTDTSTGRFLSRLIDQMLYIYKR